MCVVCDVRHVAADHSCFFFFHVFLFWCSKIKGASSSCLTTLPALIKYSQDAIQAIEQSFDFVASGNCCGSIIVAFADDVGSRWVSLPWINLKMLVTGTFIESSSPALKINLFSRLLALRSFLLSLGVWKCRTSSSRWHWVTTWPQAWWKEWEFWRRWIHCSWK